MSASSQENCIKLVIDSQNNTKNSRTLEVAISLFLNRLGGMSVLGKCEGERITDKKALNETLDKFL